MIKVNLSELAREIVEEFSFYIKDGEIAVADKDEFTDYMDYYLMDLLDDNQKLEDAEYERIYSDICPFIDLEIYNIAKKTIEQLDKEDREVLKDNIKEYDTYIESD